MATRKIIKSDLLKLLPDVSEAEIPTELISLAETYISKSRQLYVNKSEALAKEFLCAHIACELLSGKLGLPEIQTKYAPIPAAKYKALHRRFKSEAMFKQARDSGHNDIDTKRRIARDHAQELCTKHSSVPLAFIMTIVDRIVTIHRQTDVRALVIAIYLLSHQKIKKTKTIPIGLQNTLIKDLGLTKSEVEQELAFVRRKSSGTDWFEFQMPKKLNFSGKQEVTKKRRINQVSMIDPTMDLASPLFKKRFQSWKTDMITKLDAAIALKEGR